MGFTTPMNQNRDHVPSYEKTQIDDWEPHNIEAEQQLLGGILLQNEAFHKISDILQPEHFYDPLHAEIFKEAMVRIKAGHFVSPVTMKVKFETHSGLRQLGGPGYLVRMAGAAITVSMIRDYAQIIIDAYSRRTLMKAMEGARDLCMKGGDIAEAQALIELAGAKLVEADSKPPTISMLAATTKAMEMAIQSYHGEASGLITGIKSFDELTGGFFPGDLIVIGAAPSMGKTALALALAKAYGQAGHGTAFVSLEMGDYSLAQRMMANVSGVPHREMRRGTFSAENGAQLQQAAAIVAQWPIEIVQGHIRDLSAIYAAARRVQGAMEKRLPGGLRVLIVDYLQLVRAPGKDRFQIVAEVSMGLKNIAKQMGVPLIALAQINARNVTERDDKRPKLADLRESGQIEQDADLVMMLHRDDYWLERMGAPRGKDGRVSTEALVDHEAARSAAKHQMDVILAKHRHDGIGEIKLGCDMATNRIWDLHSGNVQQAMGLF